MMRTDRQYAAEAFLWLALSAGSTAAVADETSSNEKNENGRPSAWATCRVVDDKGHPLAGATKVEVLS